MAIKTYNTIFKFRRANADQWPANYVLKDGEPGFELDTGKLKIGDNKTPWSQLDYLNGTATINTDGALIYSEGLLSLNGLNGAIVGQVPAKAQDGAITWVTPLNIDTVMNSDPVNTWVEGKITAVTNRVYKGEAALVTTTNDTIQLLDTNYDPIVADINDVYSYNDGASNKKYVWSGEEWFELTGAEIYATKRNLELLDGRMTSLENNAVQSSNAVNQIKINNDKTMSVNTIGVNQLVNDDCLLILDNGHAE